MTRRAIAAAVAGLLLVGGLTVAAAQTPSVSPDTYPDGYTPPCTSNTTWCLRQRVAALEAEVNRLGDHYRAHQHATPTPSPSPTATPTVTPTPTPSPTPTPPGQTCTTPLFTSSDPHGSWADNGYIVNNEVWNTAEAGPQTIYACAWNSWYVESDQPGTGTDDSVKTYPDTQKLVSVPLNTMTSIPSSFDVTTPAGGGAVVPNSKQWNAAYDLWLDNFGTEVMVWNTWTMNWQYWYGVYDGVQVTIDGVAYAAYYNGQNAMWFIRQDVTNSGSVDLASVLRWAVQRGWLRDTQVINAINYGFEIGYTGEPTTFILNDYALAGV